MKLPHVLALCPLALGLPACSEGDVQAGEGEKDEETTEGGGLLERVRGTDLSELGVDDMKAEAKELSEELAAELDRVRDGASAAELSEELEPVLQGLRRLRDALGERMPSLDGLRREVEELRERYRADERVLEELRPLLDEVERLLR